jgi:hypothetical protein
MFRQSIDFALKRASFETNLIRVTLTSKNRKQFHLKAGAGAGCSRQEQAAGGRRQEQKESSSFMIACLTTAEAH